MEKQINRNPPSGWETPNGVPLFKNTPETPIGLLPSGRLEYSEGSSTQDSGYCSFTPTSLSGDSSIDCHHCYSINDKNYAHSTPHSSLMCFCKKSHHFENPSPCHLPKISECNVYSNRPCTSRLGIGPQLNLFDEAMDSSLYNDHMDDNRMDVEEQGPVEDHNCVLGFEEKSMDLAEANVGLTPDPQENQDIRKDTLMKLSEPVNINKLKHIKFASTGVDWIGSRPTCVKNDSTPTTKLNKFPNAAKKVMTLIKVVKHFNLCGIEKLDFLYQLCGKMHCDHIANTILSYLSEKDLNNVRQVSSTWTWIVDKDFKSYDRWRKYHNNLNMWKENCTSPVKRTPPDVVFEDSPRCLRKLDMNVCTPYQGRAHHVQSPPVSPNSARFRSFQKAGKQLKPGDRLLRCPKCYFASQDRGDPIVQCTRSGCRHRFCFWCLGEITPNSNHHCKLYSPRKCNSPSKNNTAGSKKSKKRLRRLSSFKD